MLVLELKLMSPPYTAVMEWAATMRDEVLKVAWPEARVPVPSVVEPSLKVTVPVGVPVPGATGLNVTVKVMDWPDTEGLAEEDNAVELLARLTV